MSRETPPAAKGVLPKRRARETPPAERLLTHPFAPVYDARSETLVLGSFPSAVSRARGFYYAHPRNRFWSVLAAVFGEETPADEAGKRGLLLLNRVALWDVIGSCETDGSADAGIRNAAANDFAAIFAECRITRVLCNGGTAYALFVKRAAVPAGVEVLQMPSTSPANAAWSAERLRAAWGGGLYR
ncbi:MAG: DNA-deoxyinosine glycosylase [Oscillospiraceae bacterium]|jgi:hypoxanthine-DNA glycosylase|nr:DNA-deoxyinosine glycosylase [Oscillospiraceae bacterium]